MLAPQPQVQPFMEPGKDMVPLDPDEMQNVCSRALDLAIDSPVRSAAVAKADAVAMVTAMDGAMTPRGLAAGAWTVVVEEEGQVWSAKAAARYGDKAKGMSLHDRLSQLEFSDEEDESPRSKANTHRSGNGSIRRKAAVEEDTGKQSPAGGEAPPPPTFEACEAFVAPSESDDEGR